MLYFKLADNYKNNNNRFRVRFGVRKRHRGPGTSCIAVFKNCCIYKKFICGVFGSVKYIGLLFSCRNMVYNVSLITFTENRVSVCFALLYAYTNYTCMAIG